MEQWIAIMRKIHCILQSCTWRMTEQCACVNLEPLELTGLRLCLHDLRETVCKALKNVPINWLLMSGLVSSHLFLCIARSTWISPVAQLVPPYTLSLTLPAVDRDFKNSGRLPDKLAPPTLVSKPVLLWVWPCCLEPSRVGISFSDGPQCSLLSSCLSRSLKRFFFWILHTQDVLLPPPFTGQSLS